MAKDLGYLWVAMVAWVCLGGVAQADVMVNVQLGYGAPSDQQVGPAVVGAAGDQWNFLTTANETAVPLNNTSGGASGIALTWTSDGVARPVAPSLANGFWGTPYQNLMNGFLYDSSGNRNISFSGLTANAPFDLYIYTEGDSGSDGRRLSVTVNAGLPTTTSATDHTVGTFILGQNYLYLPGVTADSGGLLNIAYSGIESEANINGLQLTGVVPEPSSSILLCLCLTVWSAQRTDRRRRRSIRAV
jgi:hypothetical protein